MILYHFPCKNKGAMMMVRKEGKYIFGEWEDAFGNQKEETGWAVH